tara:strand:+ start:871 stop:3672 length:2802 start_codon:yes stop_codon:yes gene_type:complete
MYKQLKLKNIKTFEKEQELKIAPLTLLYGENSSGKTTVLKTLDIIQNIFFKRNISMTRILSGDKFKNPLSEDTKNISSRKIHFFSSKLNKKPIHIELTLNLPYKNINPDHPLYSNNINEDYFYLEKSVEPLRGKPKKTLSRRTIGKSTYITDEMSNGSIRKMRITDTGERVGNQKKYSVSILSGSKILKSRFKFKMVPTKFFMELKYYPEIKSSKIKKIGIKDFNNKELINFERINTKYKFILDENKYGFFNKYQKENLKRSVKDLPDFFTSDCGYADYKISVKNNDIFLRNYKKYEKIFDLNEKIFERWKRTVLIFQTLNKFKFCRMGQKLDDLDINWKDFSVFVCAYVLGNNNTEFNIIKRNMDKLFLYKDKKVTDNISALAFPSEFNMDWFEKILNQQTGMEIFEVDGGTSFGWEGAEPNHKYFVNSLKKTQSNIRKYSNSILAIAEQIGNNKYANYLIIERLLNHKSSLRIFSSFFKMSYNEYLIRFKRKPIITGMGGYSDVSHSLISRNGFQATTNFEIFLQFINYINGDIPNLFKKYDSEGREIKFFDFSLNPFKRSSPHYILNNCMREIRRTVDGFIRCHPNKTENSYDVPMEEDFKLDEVQKAIGPIYDQKYLTAQMIKKRLKKLGINYKEIFVDNHEAEGIDKVKKIYKNVEILKEYYIKEINFKADFFIIDRKKNKKTVVEIRTKKIKQLKDFLSQAESIEPNGENFDDVITNNTKLRSQLNKILKPLLNLKIIVATPEWLKNMSPDTYERLSAGWDRGSFRNLWSVRKKWPKKTKFLMLQDLNFKKNFKVHGREVGKGPSNILPFLAQILSAKPNLTFLIQELENNWHPKYQSRIIKAIVEVMKSSINKKFILETHSELFILQLQKLVQKGILNKNDVSINYISREKNGNSEIINIPLNDQGGFEKPWPGGFFNERMEVLTS